MAWPCPGFIVHSHQRYDLSVWRHLLSLQVISVGTVGGSDLVKQMEQLGSDGELWSVAGSRCRSLDTTFCGKSEPCTAP